MNYIVLICIFSTSQDIGREEHLQNKPFCVKLGVKP